MFVQVIWPKGDGSPYDNEDTLYECHRRRVRHLRGDEHLFIMLDGGPVEIEISRENGAEAFVMNNEGKTIERYGWPK